MITKILLKENEPLKSSAEIRKKKAECKECCNKELEEEMSVEIMKLKDNRFLKYKNIQASKKAVSDLQQSLYFKRMVIRFYYRLRKTTTITKKQ